MVLQPRCAGRFAAAVIATLLAGCGTSEIAVTTASLVAPAAPYPDRPVEVYTRVARGLIGCWTGARRPLGATHVYSADVAPQERGGVAEIIIYERDRLRDNPRGLKAYRARFEPSGAGTALQTENLKLADAVAKPLEADVRRWAAGGTGCGEGWSAEAKAGEPEAPPADPKKKVKAVRKK